MSRLKHLPEGGVWKFGEGVTALVKSSSLDHGSKLRGSSLIPLEATAVAVQYRIVTCLITSSSPVPLKTRRVGQRCTLNLSRAQTSSRWCGVVVRRGVPV
ncbi:hypothetical protein TNCV_51861 [Trichonephila clavipes]|nr:hypothetical protein TNCV_51861 [Trichonephila clavipes]